MPLYFFNITDGESLIDEDGTELPNLEAARAEAVRTAAGAIRDLGAKFWEHPEGWRLDVVDEQGASVLTLKFSGESES